MSAYFDTPVLVFACANKQELGARARELISSCQDPISTPHALAECFNALTYRLGFSPRDVREAIRANTARVRFIALDRADYLEAIDRVVSRGLTGDKIYDALHVHAAVKAGATRIYTSNKRDFTALAPDISIEKIGL